MPTTRRTLRISDEDWARLVGFSERFVKDSELPRDAKPGAGKVSQLLRLIANGTVVVYRPPDPGTESET